MRRIWKLLGDAAVAVIAFGITIVGAFFYASMGVRSAARNMREWWDQGCEEA